MMIKEFLDIIKTTPWFQQVAAILTIAAIPYAFFRLVICRVRHKIRFISKETYHEVKLVDYPGQPQSFWLHLMVKNQGWELSRDTEGYLQEIWFRNNNRWIRKYDRLDQFRAPVKLKWAHENSIHPIDILPRKSRRIDVCYICQNVNLLHIMAEAFPIFDSFPDFMGFM